MKIKTSELIGPALDWTVELALGTHWSANGYFVHRYPGCGPYGHFDKNPQWRYSTDPSQAWPIIEREGISIIRCGDEYTVDRQGFRPRRRIPVWAAVIGEQHSIDTVYGSQGDRFGLYYCVSKDAVCGPTGLIAAMRCFVASKLGNEVDVPEELYT